MVDFLKSLDSVASDLNPIKWWGDQFNLGQSRDEARSVRAGDIERDEKWLERNSISGRIGEGTSLGLSKLAAAGIQPTNSMTATVGQNTPVISESQGYDPSARLQRKLLESQIQSQDLDNLKKLQDLEKENNTSTPVTGDSFMPNGSQNLKGGRVQTIPMQRTASHPNAPHIEAGAVSGIGFEYGQLPDGSRILYPIPSQDVKQRIEDSPYEYRNFVRDAIVPYFGSSTSKPPDSELKYKNTEWRWHPSGGWVERELSSMSKIKRNFKKRNVPNWFYE